MEKSNNRWNLKKAQGKMSKKKIKIKIKLKLKLKDQQSLSVKATTVRMLGF